jgi:hypothetical protein
MMSKKVLKHVQSINRNELKLNSASFWSYCTELNSNKLSLIIIIIIIIKIQKLRNNKVCNTRCVLQITKAFQLISKLII